MTNTYDFSRQPNETKFDHLVRISVDKINKLHNKEWTDIKDEFNFEHSSDNLRKYAKGWYLMVENNQSVVETDESPIINYKQTTEILGDGNQRSDKVIPMTDAQSKDVNFLLQSHGFNVDEWEITSAKNSIWNANSKTDGIRTLYSSKITVKPKVDGFNVEKFLEKLKSNVKQSKLSIVKNNQGENMLVIPFFDLHFGIATLQTYSEVLSKTISKIKSKKWDKILIIFGQDCLHNDGFTGQTTSGTMIDKVDMEQAWADLHTFYTSIFDEAIKNANSVDAIFSNGNHDQSMGWTFGKLLEYQYPQVNFDSQMKQFKGYLWKNIFIGATHGDKGANRIFEVFLAEYGKLIASATTKEILSGHLHHQKTIDKYGLVHRTLGSGVPTDEYHSDNGFVGAQKQFQLLEYNSDYPEAVYFV